MFRRCFSVLALAMSVVLAGCAHAPQPTRPAMVPDTGENLIVPGELELYPTYNAIGLELPYSGDADGDATASFVWRRVDETQWRDGVDFTVDRERKLMWASIWPLKPDEVVEVKLTLADPEPVQMIQKAARTRFAVIEPPVAGRKFYVSPKGNDEHPGTKDQPFATLAHASSILQAGDTLYAMSGVYREGNLFGWRKGTAVKPILVTAAPGEKPILDSSMQIMPNSNAWEEHHDGVYFTTKANFGDSSGYVTQNGKRVFPYRSLEDLTQDTRDVKRAFFFDASTGKLYLRTGLGSSPEDHHYTFSQHEHGVFLEGSRHVVIRGFVMRNYGASPVRISGPADSNVIINNVIHNSQNGVFMKDERCVNNLIIDNEIYEPGLSDFNWNAIKRSDFGRQGVNLLYAGRGNCVIGNRIHGWFDGIVYLSWKRPEAINIHRDSDIMFNELFNFGDDALEMDGGGVNMRVHGNRIRNAHTAISLAPIERGPVYVTRNDATYHSLLFKLSVGGCTSYGWTYAYHNSGYTLDNSNNGTMIRMTTIIPLENKVFKNNAMIGSEYAIHNGNDTHVFDYNSYFNTPQTGPRAFHYNGVRHMSIEAFHEATGQEKHGLYVDPQFVSTPDLGAYTEAQAPMADGITIGDMRLKPTSPLINRGVRIRGINDDHHGQSPDIGAYEFVP